MQIITLKEREAMRIQMAFFLVIKESHHSEHVPVDELVISIQSFTHTSRFYGKLHESRK